MIKWPIAIFAVVSFGACVVTMPSTAVAAQTILASERREQNAHKHWIETTLAAMGRDPSTNLPADILLAYAPAGSKNRLERKEDKIQRDWYFKTLKRIHGIQVGTTRARLLKVFTSEGGPASRVHQTFADRTCPYIKVDVDFRPAEHRHHAPHAAGEDASEPGDVVTKISGAYLAYMIVY